jgi:hypothetical protein
VSERYLELTRLPDGSFSATFADDRPAVRVVGWADIRRLRDRHHLSDHWNGADREAFIAEVGHPFDDWWNSLAPATRTALMADPDGPVPPDQGELVRRSLRDESGRDGLRVEGSYFTAPVREYIARRAAAAAAHPPAT